LHVNRLQAIHGEHLIKLCLSKAVIWYLVWGGRKALQVSLAKLTVRMRNIQFVQITGKEPNNFFILYSVALKGNCM